MKIIIILLLLALASAQIISRLDDNRPTILDANTTIVSTLGNFRAYLLRRNCTILIEKFNVTRNKYIFHGFCLPHSFKKGSCQALKVRNGSIYTDR